MAGTLEVLLELQSERDVLKETAQTILEFPKRLEYDCMVPMSKVAFMAGRIIHTNEFMLQGEVAIENSKPRGAEQQSKPSNFEKNGQWYSYSDAAEILKTRAAALDRQILRLEASDGVYSSARLDDVFKAHDAVKKVTSGPSSDAPLSSATFDKYNNEDLSYRNENKGSGASGHGTDADADTDAIDGAENVGGIFEIREFIDSEGNEMKNEVVNLQQEMAEIEEKLGSFVSMASPVIGTASTPLGKGLVRNSQDISALLSSVQKMTSEMQEPPQPETEVSDGKSSITDSTTELEILSKLDYLEKEEEEWQRESDAANRIRIKEKELQARALPEAGPGGWKKGFFGKSSTHPAKTVSTELKRSARPHASSSSSSSRDTSASESDSSNRIFSHKDGQKEVFDPIRAVDITEKSSLVWAEKTPSPATRVIDAVATPLTSRDTVKKKIVPISKAFSGNVMERFP